MPSGRLTDYNDEIVEKAWEYVNEAHIEKGHIIPTIAGLAMHIGVSRDTCYEWAKHEDKLFSDIMENLMQIQEQELVSKGLTGKFVSPITKLLLTKHGYSDKIEQDNTSSDGSNAPNTIIIKGAGE